MTARTIAQSAVSAVSIYMRQVYMWMTAGLAITVAASIIQGVTVSASSQFIGIIMHIISTGSMVLVAGSIYKKRHTRKGAAIALAAGVVTMTAAMSVCNLIFTPIFILPKIFLRLFLFFP